MKSNHFWRLEKRAYSSLTLLLLSLPLSWLIHISLPIHYFSLLHSDFALYFFAVVSSACYSPSYTTQREINRLFILFKYYFRSANSRFILITLHTVTGNEKKMKNNNNKKNKKKKKKQNKKLLMQRLLND